MLATRARRLCLLSGVLLGIVVPPLWRTFVVDRLSARLSARLDRRVIVGGVRPGLRGLVATDVQIFGAAPFADGLLARAERVEMRIGGAVVVDGLDVDYIRAGRTDNLWPPRTAAASGPTASSRPWPDVTVRRARVRGFLRMGEGGPRVTLRVGDADLALDGARRTARLDARHVVLEVTGRVTAELPRLTAQAALAEPSLVLKGSGGTLRLPASPPALVDVTLEGTADPAGIGLTLTQGAPGEPQSLVARIDAASDGLHATWEAVALPLGPLDTAARRYGIDLRRARVTVRGRLDAPTGSHTVSFDLRTDVYGFDIDARALDRRAWTDLSLHAHLPGRFELGGVPTLRLDGAEIEAAGFPLRTSGFVELGAAPRGEIAVATREGDDSTIDCAGLLIRQPRPVQEALAGLDLGGRLGLSASVRFDAADLDAMTMAFDVARTCDVVREPDVIARLPGPGGAVEYVAEDADGAPRPFPLGPANPSFARLAEMPGHLPAAFMTSEDAHFHSHRGFDIEMIRRAFIYDLQVGSFAKGASTITQQLAKNLFLDRGRTLARKLEETVLAWRLDQRVSKARTLELYLNAVELGPGVYGVKDAAAYYFGKPVGRLSPLESAHLASLLPNPKGLARRFADGRVDSGWLHHLYDLLSMMKRSGRLSAADLTAATGGVLVLRKI